MPTNLALDDKLLSEALRIGGQRTKRDTVLLLPRIVAAREEARGFSTLNSRLSTRGFAAFGCGGAALRTRPCASTFRGGSAATSSSSSGPSTSTRLGAARRGGGGGGSAGHLRRLDGAAAASGQGTRSGNRPSARPSAGHGPADSRSWYRLAGGPERNQGGRPV